MKNKYHVYMTQEAELLVINLTPDLIVEFYGDGIATALEYLGPL